MLDTQVIYCGDNSDVLVRLPDASVDLVYVDPPFNSNRVYETFWGETKEKRAFEDRHESTEAYIRYMAPRCEELARILKPTGSLYYHCDWHASHYVKVMLDRIFGENNFNSEIIWRRTNAKSQSYKTFPNNHDTIFFYARGKDYTFSRLFLPHSPGYVEKFYKNVEPETGRRYMSDNLTAPEVRHGASGETWHGIDVTAKGLHWKYTVDKLDEFNRQGRILWPKKKGGVPRFKRYLDEMKGVAVDSLWMDIPPIAAHADERIGFPTQKPLALLERIIKASSGPDDIVLDAFCGCGTALVASEKLDRRWIGIDSSPTACRVMADRLTEVCKLRQDSDFFVVGLPRGEEELRRMPPFEFQNWAVLALGKGGSPNRRKTGDKGIDGRFYPVAAESKKDVRDEGFAFMHWYPVQVKQKDKAGRPDIDAFETAIQREDKRKGIFVSFDYTSDAKREIDAFLRRTGRLIVPLTVRQLLDIDEVELAKMLA